MTPRNQIKRRADRLFRTIPEPTPPPTAAEVASSAITDHAAYLARAELKKAALDYAAAILIGGTEVVNAAFARLEATAKGYR